MVSKKLRHRAAWQAIFVVFAALLVQVGPLRALADPGCNPGGVYLLFARGSTAGFESEDQRVFVGHLLGQFPGAAWAELGNLDRNQRLDQGEYPAGPFWGGIDYDDGVEIGVNEFITHLNHRYSPEGRGCTTETAVIGGYSEGAEVVGKALNRSPGLNYWARRSIGYVALYGDPENNRNCSGTAWWARGNGWCARSGVRGARDPYVPEEYKGRLGSWCDTLDGFCNNSGMPGNHITIYRDYWYQQSAPEIAGAARTKQAELNPPAPQPTPQPAPAPALTGPDLYFVKTRNTGSGRVEIHSATPQERYKGGQHTPACFGTNEQNNGWFQMVGPDLAYVKTKQTGSGYVEIHLCTAASGWHTVRSYVTYISTSDQDNGWFQLVGDTLFFIKTKNVSSGRVEVHSASRVSDYKSGIHEASRFSAIDHSNGWFQMVGPDLYFIKTRNVGNPQNRVELHWALASSAYKTGSQALSRFGTEERDNGWFQMVHHDLNFIKTRNTGSGYVELHTATAASGWREGIGRDTWLSPLDQSNGWFQVGLK